MGCSISGGETQMPVKSVRCLESHPKKTANNMKLVHRLEFPSIILGAM